MNTDLVNQVRASQVGKMGSFLIIGQVFADAIDHHHHQGAIIHVQPIGAADELIVAISCKRAVNISAQVWLVKSCHDGWVFFSCRFLWVGMTVDLDQ